MTHTTVPRTSWRRTSSALGAATLLGLAVAGPALARPEPQNVGSTAPGAVATTPRAITRGHDLTPNGSSANAAEHRLSAPKPDGPPSYNTWPHGNSFTPVTHTPSRARVLDATSTPYSEIGLGVMGGALLTAVAVGAVSARNRHHALPA